MEQNRRSCLEPAPVPGWLDNSMGSWTMAGFVAAYHPLTFALLGAGVGIWQEVLGMGAVSGEPDKGA